MVSDIDLGRAEETCDLARKEGAEAAIAVRSDVTSLSDVEALAAEAERAFGGADVVINNAGVAVAGLVGELPIPDWDFVLRVNLWGVIHGCHVFVPKLRARGSGFLLNVASCAGIASLPEMAPYNVSKAAVISLSETLAIELSEANIQVSCLCPTFFRTNLMDSFRGGGRQRTIADALVNKSHVTADEIAKAGLRGLEKGELIVVPQLDGTLVWRAKRYVPGLYRAALRVNQKLDLLGRAMGGGRS